jgi:hypothetical protein
MIRISGDEPPASLSAAWRLATLMGIFGVFNYYWLVMLFLNMVYPTAAFAQIDSKMEAEQKTQTITLSEIEEIMVTIRGHRHMARGVQRGRRRLQAATLRAGDAWNGGKAVLGVARP